MNKEPAVIPVVDQGLGNSAYLVDLGRGRALAVDASRDLRGLRRAAESAGLRVAFAADTHLHADFVSGAVQLAATDGAEVLASAAGHREFGHRALDDGDEVDLGGLRLRAIATPGHTGEHLAFALMDGDRTVGVFTGGSLLVGSAARTDLVDPALTGELARAQYASIRRLLTLPDQTIIWPTHGAGSLCSAPAGADRISTIGRERATNPLLAPSTSPASPRTPVGEEEFVARLSAGLGTYPAYFGRLGEVNRRGPALLPASVRLPPLRPSAVRDLVARGGQIVDVRPVGAFAAGHIPGSVSNPLRAAFGTWLGWLTDPDLPIVVVRDADQDIEEVAWQARKIGFEHLDGELDGGLDAWRAAGLPVAEATLVTADQAATHAGSLPTSLLDVRQAGEFAAGHVRGSAHLELARLLDPAAVAVAVPDGPVLVMCGHGERAMTAASLLERAGRTDLVVLAGGFDELAAVLG